MTETAKIKKPRATASQRRLAILAAGDICDKVADQLHRVQPELLTLVVRELRSLLGDLDLDEIAKCDDAEGQQPPALVNDLPV